MTVTKLTNYGYSVCYKITENASRAKIATAVTNDLISNFLNTNKIKDSKFIELVKSPKANNSFLRFQKGLFVSTPKANDYYLENKQWPSIQDVVMLDTGRLNNCVGRINFKSDQVNVLLQVLMRYDITPYTLMPTLDNIAKATKYSKAITKNITL